MSKQDQKETQDNSKKEQSPSLASLLYGIVKGSVQNSNASKSQTHSAATDDIEVTGGASFEELPDDSYTFEFDASTNRGKATSSMLQMFRALGLNLEAQEDQSPQFAESHREEDPDLNPSTEMPATQSEHTSDHSHSFWKNDEPSSIVTSSSPTPESDKAGSTPT